MTPGHRDLRTNKHGAAAQAADEQEWGGGGWPCAVSRGSMMAEAREAQQLLG